MSVIYAGVDGGLGSVLDGIGAESQGSLDAAFGSVFEADLTVVEFGDFFDEGEA